MRFIHYFIIAAILFSLSACSKEENEQIQGYESKKEEEKGISRWKEAPVKVKETIINNIDWKVSPVFRSGGYRMRGVPNKVGFIDAPFIANKIDKYMWHFWGESIPKGELTIVAVKEGSKDIAPALMQDGISVWTTNVPGGPNNGADAHLPSNIRLSEPGKWALLVYLGDAFLDYVVIEVK